MSEAYQPPAKLQVVVDKYNSFTSTSLNRPISGSTRDEPLQVGSARIQLYSLGTPNGKKVSIFLEELGVDYDAYTVNIGKGDQFGTGFVGVNPNSKIPALVDLDGPDGEKIDLFESGSILYYLAEKFPNPFLPENPRLRAEIRNWAFWQMAGQGPIFGNFGHFFVYAPDNVDRDYGVLRFGMEVKRLCHVIETHLEGKTYLVGEQYTLADIINFPWFHALRTGYKHKNGNDANNFLDFVQDYPNIQAWIDRIAARPAVQRGLQVNGFTGPAKPWLVANDGAK